jgi:hypothetical protein
MIASLVDFLSEPAGLDRWWAFAGLIVWGALVVSMYVNRPGSGS